MGKFMGGAPPVGRTQPVIVDAMQYLGFTENGRDIEIWLGESFNSHVPSRNEIEIKMRTRLCTASAGDYIVKGDRGYVRVCKPDVFAATYEPAE